MPERAAQSLDYISLHPRTTVFSWSISRDTERAVRSVSHVYPYVDYGPSVVQCVYKRYSSSERSLPRPYLQDTVLSRNVLYRLYRTTLVELMHRTDGGATCTSSFLAVQQEGSAGSQNIRRSPAAKTTTSIVCVWLPTLCGRVNRIGTITYLPSFYFVCCASLEGRSPKRNISLSEGKINTPTISRRCGCHRPAMMIALREYIQCDATIY